MKRQSWALRGPWCERRYDGTAQGGTERSAYFDLFTAGTIWRACVILGLVVVRPWSISGGPSPRAPDTFGGRIACDGAGDLASLSLDYGSEQVGKNLELIRRLTVPEALGLRPESLKAGSGQ
jgi:hypothetical protein